MWLCSFLGIPGNRLPLSGWSSENLMLLFVNAAAQFLISTLFHLWSGSRLASYASDFTPGQCFCWIQQPADSGESVLCWKTLPALLIPSVFPTCDSACFVLWFCTELQQLPAVPRQRPADILCSLSPGMLSPAFPAGSVCPELLCASSPCCDFRERGWMPALGDG